MTDADKAVALAAEVELALLGYDAHRLGHEWLEQKLYGPAQRFFKVAALCAVPDAQHHIDALELSNFEQIAECRWTGDADDRVRRKRRHNRILRRFPVVARVVRRTRTFRELLLCAGLMVALVLASGSLGSDRAGTPPPASTMLEQPPAAGPVTRFDLSPAQGAAAQSVLPAPAASASTGRGQATDPQRPGRTEVAPSAGPSGSKAPADATDPLGSAGRRYLGLPPSTTEWRRLEFEPPTDTAFKSTLLSVGGAPCRWRFTGRATPETRTTGSTTEELVVKPRESRSLTVTINGWPVFAVEVKGAEPAACLLVDPVFGPPEEQIGGADALADPLEVLADGPPNRSQPPSGSPSPSTPASPSTSPSASPSVSPSPSSSAPPSASASAAPTGPSDKKGQTYGQ